VTSRLSHPESINSDDHEKKKVEQRKLLGQEINPRDGESAMQRRPPGPQQEERGNLTIRRANDSENAPSGRSGLGTGSHGWRHGGNCANDGQKGRHR